MTISKRLRDAIRLSSHRQFILARAIGVHPSTLSGWLSGAFPVKAGDMRVLNLADILGVPAAEAFSDDPTPESLRAEIESRSRR